MTTPRLVRPQRLLAAMLSLAIVLAALAPSVSLPVPFARAQEEPVPSGDVIVVLEEDSTRAEVRAEAAEKGVQPDAVFTEVIDGFAADVTQAEAEALAADPDVAGVFPNSPVYAAAQTLPTGVDRIDADHYPPVAVGDGIEDAVDVDIAVLDSGIDGANADLNVQSTGMDCQETAGGYLVDDTGHGTHVAGIAAARDNDLDTVGVAPGARLHSVKVLRAPTGPGGNSSGEGSIDDLICGLEWVVLHADVIDVVNMSITGGGEEGPACGQPGVTPLHTSICQTVDAGIPVVVAAGNGGVDANLTIPATYAEVIAVSAIADANGQPGGGAAGCSVTSGADDRLASYSNFGPDVDIAAPGTCIVSSARGGGTTSKSGTSMAAPHVAGAAGLYLAANPGALPADVRAWLLTTASQPQNSLVGFTGDRDDSPEPFLWLGDPIQSTMTPSATATATSTSTATSTATATSTPQPTVPYPLSGGGRSPQSASYTYVRDGNLDTSWKTKLMSSGPPASGFVYVDIGSPRSIGTIRWIFGEYGYADVFRIETSNDLATWTVVTRRNGKPPGAWIEKQLEIPVTARYVRFFFENPRADRYLGGLAEIQIWAPGGAPPFPTATPTPTATPVLGGGGAYAIVGSSQTSNALDAGLAHDGSQSTSWRTSYGIPAPASAEARFQISSVQRIGSVRWVFNVGGRADSFVIEVSNDDISDPGAFWETVFTGTNATSGVWQEQDLAPGTTGKSVRWHFTNPNGDAVLGSLAEVEIAPPLGGGSLPDPETTSTPILTATATGATSATERPSATTAPAETQTAVSTETPASTLLPTEEPADASPIAADESPTPSPTDVPLPAARTETPTAAADAPIPTATVESPSPTVAPTTTPTTAVTSPAAVEPTAAEPSVEPVTAAAVQPTSTPTAESRPSNTVPVVGVRRTSNSANGWTALDGDPTTVWRTTVTPPGRLAIISLDLGDPTSIAALRILVAEDGFTGSLTVEVSDDLASWSAVADSTPADLPAGSWASLPFDAPVETRYIRLVVVNPGPLDTLGGAAEIEVLPWDDSS